MSTKVYLNFNTCYSLISYALQINLLIETVNMRYTDTDRYLCIFFK